MPSHSLGFLPQIHNAMGPLPRYSRENWDARPLFIGWSLWTTGVHALARLLITLVMIAITAFYFASAED